MDELYIWDFSKLDIIAFIGGGGKTTTISVLANQIIATGKRVLVTTTTKMWPQLKGAKDPFLAKDQDTFRAWLAKADKNQLEFLGQSINQEGKLCGIPRQWIEEYEQDLVSCFDLVLIEADGSRGKSLKWPLATEPIIPNNTKAIIGVVGLDILGTTLSEANVFRAEALSLNLGLPLGHKISWTTLEKHITHPGGLFGQVPQHIPVILLLNKYRSEMARDLQQLLSSLLSNREFTTRAIKIVVADMQREPIKIDRVINCV